MKIKLQPFLFSRADLQAIAQSTMHCHDGLTRLIKLMQDIHRFRDADAAALTHSESDYFNRLAAKLEADVSLAIHLNLLNAGLILDGYLDLDRLSQQCLIHKKRPIEGRGYEC